MQWRVFLLVSTATISIITGCGLSELLERASFVKPCVRGCKKRGNEEASCKPYCECSYDYLNKLGEIEALLKDDSYPADDLLFLVGNATECGQDFWQQSCALGPETQSVDPETTRAYCSCALEYLKTENLQTAYVKASMSGKDLTEFRAGMMVECGSDLIDAVFINAFVKSCGTGATCEREASCILKQVRGTEPRTEGTKFLFESLGRDPMKESDAQVFEAARQACTRNPP